MSNVAVIDQARPREQRIQVIDAVPVLDTGRFEQMCRVAKLMASSNLIPETLCATYEGTGANRVTKWLPLETVTANCFLIVNQAVGWGMDPFAVAQCASVVHGKVCYEGKLIAAVIEQKLGVRLDFEWNDKQGDALGITVRGDLGGKVREIRGTVGEWKTTGNNSPWTKPAQARMQLAYRGSRDWARLHAPSVMLGVYSSDEMDAAIDRQERMPTRPALVSEGPAAPPRSLPLAPRLPPPPPPAPPAAKADLPKQTPPAPPKVASDPVQTAQTGFDFDAFRAALVAAPDNIDAKSVVFDEWVKSRQDGMSMEELEEAQNVLNEVCAPLWDASK